MFPFGKIFFLIASLLIPFISFSQKKGFLEFSGRCIQNYNPVKDARVAVFSGPTKIAEVRTTKNGQFMFDLDFGQDYKVVFAKSGSPEMHLLIQASKCPVDKKIFPAYEIDIAFFDFRDSEINDQAFKNPISKVVYDQRGYFKDDEEYLTSFLSTIYNSEKETKLNEELKILRQSQELLAIVKQEEDKSPFDINLVEAPVSIDHLIHAEIKNSPTEKSLSKTKKELVSKREKMIMDQLVFLAKKDQKQTSNEKNKTIKVQQEREFLELISNSKNGLEEKQQVAEFKKIIIALEQQALLKARANEIKNGIKSKSRIKSINKGILNLEVNALINQTASYIKSQQTDVSKENKMQVKTMVGIVTDVTHEQLKTISEIIVSSQDVSEKYKKEKYNFGLVYYYKNEKPISEKQYHESLAQYNIPR